MLNVHQLAAIFICLKRSPFLATLEDLDLIRQDWNNEEVIKEIATFVAMAPNLRKCYIGE